MTTRPDGVKVGPLWFELVYDAGEVQRVARAQAQDVYGQTNFEEMKIFIDDSRVERAQKDTVLHEIIHCVHWTTNMDAALAIILKNGDEKEAEDVEEWITGLQCTTLLGIIQDNPTLIAWLSETP